MKRDHSVIKHKEEQDAIVAIMWPSLWDLDSLGWVSQDSTGIEKVELTDCRWIVYFLPSKLHG